MKFYFSSSNNKDSINAKRRLIKKYGQNKVEECDVIVPLGGDGFLLRNLRQYYKLNKDFYGINYGSVGFLMNAKSNKDLDKIVEKSKTTILYPLEMKAENVNKKSYSTIAFNEVSLMRQTHQAAKISIKVNNILRMKELVCDGVLLSTPAGSTAYNLSAHGSIIPLDSNLLALTPISAFRPRRWRGALLKQNTNIEFKIEEFKNRKVSVSADNIEFKNIKKVKIKGKKNIFCKLLFNDEQSIDEKVLKEQFLD